MKKLFWKKGFTIIEVLVTVAILAVLSTVISISVSAYMKQAEEKSQRTDIESAYSSCSAVFAEINSGFSTVSSSDLDTVFLDRLGKNVKQITRLGDNDQPKLSGLTIPGYYIWYRYGKQPLLDDSGKPYVDPLSKNEYYIDTVLYKVDADKEGWRIQNGTLFKNGVVVN